MADVQRDENQVEVSEVKTVDFYGDQVTAAQTKDGEVYVPLKPLASLLGLNYSGQLQRARRDPVLSKRLHNIEIETSGGLQLFSCLPLDLLPGWLFGITTGKIEPSLQEKLNRYREECFRVLWNAFKGDVLPAARVEDTGLTPAQQILQQVEAMYKLAQQQVELERQQAELEHKHKVMADYMRGHVQRTNNRLSSHDAALAAQDTSLTDHDSRIVSLELRLGPEATVNYQQAAEISMAVKNVGILLTGIKGMNGYGQVYAELYRLYGVSSYKNLQQTKYEAVLKWLREWHQQLLDSLAD